MSLDPVQHAVFAYYVAGPANDLNIAGRWYPRGEVVLIIEDKITVAVRKFGMKARGSAKIVATTLIDQLMEKGAWATKANDFGGTMHQFQPDVFKASLKEIQSSDPLIVEAQGQGPEFWVDKFAALTAA